MTRAALTEKIVRTKIEQGLTWKGIAEQIGGLSKEFITAGLLGQMQLSAEVAEKAGVILGLDAYEVKLLQQVPYRGSL